MMKLTIDQVKTIRWEKVTRGPLSLAGVESVAFCKAFPGNIHDMREAMVGFNGMLRDDFVYYMEPTREGEPDSEPEVCQVVGVSRAGAFKLSRLDPKTAEEAATEILTLPINCTPAKGFKLGRRVI